MRLTMIKPPQMEISPENMALAIIAMDQLNAKVSIRRIDGEEHIVVDVGDYLSKENAFRMGMVLQLVLTLGNVPKGQLIVEEE